MYVVGNVCDRSNYTIVCSSDIVVVVMKMNSDICVVCFGKRPDFHVVSVRAACGHSLQVGLPIVVNLLLSGRRTVERGRVRADVLSLRISSLTSANFDVDEWFVLIRRFSHVLNDGRADLLVFALVAINLVRQSIEETIACKRKQSISEICSNLAAWWGIGGFWVVSWTYRRQRSRQLSAREASARGTLPSEPWCATREDAVCERDEEM